jgi:hypothetical protein
MKVYCYGCGTGEETDWLVRCRHCDTKNIGIEPDEGWHLICRLFAQSKRWMGDSDELSLPWWFSTHPEYLPEWEAFKAQLQNVQFPPLPEGYVERQDIYNFWINSSGVLPLQMGSEASLRGAPFLGPLVHQLASTYADYHYRQRQRVEAGHREQAERERPNPKAGKKKASLLKRRRLEGL